MTRLFTIITLVALSALVVTGCTPGEYQNALNETGDANVDADADIDADTDENEDNMDDDADGDTDVDADVDVDGDVDDDADDDADDADDNTVEAGNEVIIELTGDNFAYSQETLEVNEGDRVTIMFESTEGFHDRVVDEFNASTDRVEEGEATSVTFVADEAGEFEYYCSVGEHRANGMVGTLVVNASDDDDDADDDDNNGDDDLEVESDTEVDVEVEGGADTDEDNQ